VYGQRVARRGQAQVHWHCYLLLAPTMQRAMVQQAMQPGGIVLTVTLQHRPEW
jgi:hypothetical protein